MHETDRHYLEALLRGYRMSEPDELDEARDKIMETIHMHVMDDRVKCINAIAKKITASDQPLNTMFNAGLVEAMAIIAGKGK